MTSETIKEVSGKNVEEYKNGLYYIHGSTEDDTAFFDPVEKVYYIYFAMHGFSECLYFKSADKP